ncbi:MAG: protein kinase [Vicinamibacteria bacterium]
MTLAPGTRLGPYEITTSIGAGGMGQVFRGRDTRLSRDVAIKVLPEEFARDHERVARFKREAQILASLNHPNIAGIHGLEEQDGTVAIAMELVEGEDLSERLSSGPISMDEVLAIAKQIAEGLEDAHEHGIIHRDLKPANIKVTSDGKVKILDFGLAKAMEGAATASGSSSGADSQLSHSPTLTHQGTVAGMILGTAAYMSPEQARGKKVDKRADIWSFGVVLYEMLVGRRLFSGETVSDVLAAVLTRDIDWAHLPLATPSAVQELLRRCLDRNPKNRLHDIGDARYVLDEAQRGVSAPTLIEPRGTPARRPILAVAGLFALVLVLGIVIGRRTAPRGGANTGFRGQFEIAPPDKSTFVSGLAISQDGKNIAFVARGEDGRTRLFSRAINESVAKELPGTVDARYPFWAPDGRKIAFFAQNHLRVSDLLGGLPRVVADTGASEDVRGGAWGADDRIIFTPAFAGPIFSVAASGGAVTPATEMGNEGMGTHRFPSFLPDGRRFLFYASLGTGLEPGVLYIGRLGGSLKPKRLGPATSTAAYVEPGYLLYVQGDSLVAHRFDSDREELVGDPIPLGLSLPGSISVSGQRSLAVSENGILVYRMDKRSATRLVWLDRAGRELQSLPSEVDTWHYGPTLSPNGKLLAVSHYEAGSTSGGVWVHDLERNLATRLTADDKSDDTVLVWSPDSTEIAYASASSGGGRINRIAVSTPGRPRTVVDAPTFVSPSAWLPDGRLIYTAFNGSGRSNPYIKLLAADAAPLALGSDKVSEYGVDASPDGRWMAFQADPTRRMEVYLRRVDDQTGSSTIRVSTEGGTAPRWRRDGRELLYLADSGKLMSVTMKGLDPPQPGPPTPMFDPQLEPGTDRQYDLSLDGKRLIVNRTLVLNQVPISVLINWQDRLSRDQSAR